METEKRVQCFTYDVIDVAIQPFARRVSDIRPATTRRSVMFTPSLSAFHVS